MPRPEVRETIDTEVIVKKRTLAVLSRSGVLDYSHGIFQDDMNFAVVSLANSQSPYKVFQYEEFSLDFVERVRELNQLEKITTLCLFGGVAFELLAKKEEFMDFVVFTELLDRKEDLPIVGSVDYESFVNRYELVFESQVFVNEVGRWRFRIFKFKG